MIWRTLLLALSGMVLAIAASAHDGMDAWYRSLLATDGTSCCNMRDCSPVDARLKSGVWGGRLLWRGC